MPVSAEYHDDDFDYDEWKETMATRFTLPAISVETTLASTSEAFDVSPSSWDDFFDKHNLGKFYKPRQYIYSEFHDYLSKPALERVLEVGCGYGCTMYPLLAHHNLTYLATDYSHEALHILQLNPLFNPSHITCKLWNFVEKPCESLVTFQPQLILSIFALSAVHPSLHFDCFKYLKQLLTHSINEKKSEENYKPVILFRDYAVHDMTMYRHKIRLGEHLFQRADGTLAYYFSEEYLRHTAAQAGLTVIEFKYATVINRNRRKQQEIHRVFIHAVFGISDD